MTLARLSPESVGICATERPRLNRAQLAWASAGVLPPLCALALAWLPDALRAGVAAILGGAVVLLCGPVLLGRFLDAAPRGPGRHILSRKGLDVLEGRP